MIKELKAKSGFSLIEIIVSLAILGVVMIPIGSIFVTTIKINKESEKILLASQLSQKYMEQLKGSSNPSSEIIPPVDTSTGFIIEANVEPFKKNEFQLPSNDDNFPIDYQYNGYPPSNPPKINTLYKLTVKIVDRNNTVQLAKLLSLKTIK